MRFIINEKVYDTDKMELIGQVRKWYAANDWFTIRMLGEGYGKHFDCMLYRSQKGNYLLTHESSTDTTIGEAITESDAKALLRQYDYDAYVKLYGELEEA